LDVDAGVGDATAPDGDAVVSDATAEGSRDAPTSKYASAVLDAGPLLYLRFGEPSGLTAVDEMHHADGKYPLAGASLGVQGALANDLNTAVHLDGTRGIEMPKGADFAGPDQAFTVEIWVKPDVAGAFAFLVDNENMSSRGGWDLASGAHVSFERYASDANHIAAPSSTELTLAWHHIVGVCDGVNQLLWIDGIMAGSTQGHLTLPSVTMGWMVGAENCQPDPCTTNGFAGAVDELAVYSRALLQAEVLAHFHAAQ
jgi:hypothetical protein